MLGAITDCVLDLVMETHDFHYSHTRPGAGASKPLHRYFSNKLLVLQKVASEADLNVKAVVAAFNQEKALVGAFSVITNLRMQLFEALLEDGKTVILYLHGNSANRAGAHRVELYRVLRALDCHVVCCDYRGYADSTPAMPNETGVVTDARAVSLNLE